MSLLIQKEGILTTIQDAGRFGYRSYGINPNGVMDRTAAQLINILLENDENEAVLEMHFPAGEIVFQKGCLFALGGADFGAKLGDSKIENWRIYRGRKGSSLRFTEKEFGSRAYLAVKGGYDLKGWLGSKSTNLTAGLGGFEGRKLKKGDVLPLREKFKIRTAVPKYAVSRSLIPRYARFPTVRVIAGAEFEMLTALSQEHFLKNTFVISHESNRMGYRLEGESLHLLHEASLLSSSAGFGTIQLLPDGRLIVLMADHQTTGGYPRIAHLISADLPLLAQLGENDKVAFQMISVEEAEEILMAIERELCFLRLGIRMNYFGGYNICAIFAIGRCFPLI